jgi:predicted nucleotidyltransferase
VADDVSDRLREFFASRANGLVAAWLYGSVARGTDTRISDVDVAVLYRLAPERSFEGLPLVLEGDLEKLLRRKVQVVALNDAPADLVHRVLRDGELLLDVDRSARIAFEVRARNDYFDLEPLRREYRRLGGDAR